MDPGERHVVILLHGIRDTGVWQGIVGGALEAAGMSVQPIRYDAYFGLVRFWLPPLRGKAVARAEGKIDGVIGRPGVDAPARISVIAHSFGTYVICKILQKRSDIKIDNLILCGSVVDIHYPISAVAPRVSGRIVNECSTRDVWPAAAYSLSWGFGEVGTNGFGAAPVHDRFHDLGHGGYLTTDFADRFWVPLLKEGRVEDSGLQPGDYFRKIPTRVRFLLAVRLRWLIALVLVLPAVWACSRLVETFNRPAAGSQVEGRSMAYEAARRFLDQRVRPDEAEGYRLHWLSKLLAELDREADSKRKNGQDAAVLLFKSEAFDRPVRDFKAVSDTFSNDSSIQLLPFGFCEHEGAFRPVALGVGRDNLLRVPEQYLRAGDTLWILVLAASGSENLKAPESFYLKVE